MDTQKARDQKAVEEVAEKLIGQFDTVQIFVTRYEGGDNGGTYNLSIGRGDWMARYAMVRNWLIRKDEETRLEVRSENEDL